MGYVYFFLAEHLYLLLDFGLGEKFLGEAGLGLYLYVPISLNTLFQGPGAGKEYLLESSSISFFKCFSIKSLRMIVK